MKTNQKLTTLALIFMLCLGLVVTPALAQGDPDRPKLYVASYTTDQGMNVNPYSRFVFEFTLKNNGVKDALAVLISFNSADFAPWQAGGVVSVDDKDIVGNDVDTVTVRHEFKVADDSSWKYSGAMQAIVTYMDAGGTQYSETFNFTLGINQQVVGPTQTPTFSPAAQKPLIVVSKVQTSVDPLQPGTNFKLKLVLNNLGPSDARGVSLVYGGGAQLNVNESGTPQPGTVGGQQSELTNFAPIGSSNVVLIGDVASMGTASVESEFIVNVTTVPGAYPLKLSFVFTDPKGIRYIDDAVVTLLVYSLPQLEVAFYRDPGMINVGMPVQLPIQITNISRKTVILGNATVRSKTGQLENATSLVGSLDPGGYYTMDVMFTPSEEGATPLDLEIRYTDDFNQLRTYNTKLEVEVSPAMQMPIGGQPVIGPDGKPVLGPDGTPLLSNPDNPGMDGFPMPEEPASEPGFFAKVWNAIKSFFGFGTKHETPTDMGPMQDAPDFEGSPQGKRLPIEVNRG